MTLGLPYTSEIPVKMKRPLASGDFSYRERDSDLDWALQSPDVRTYRQRRPPRWMCGDHKKLRHVASYFFKHSSMHGLHYFQSNSRRTSCFAKVVYRLIFGVCFIMMMASVVFLSQESFSTESVYISSTSKEGANGHTEDPLYPKFPRITICRRPAFARRTNDSEQEVLEYAYIGLGYPFSTLDPEERTMMLESVLIKKKRGFQRPRMLAFAERLRSLKDRYNDLKASIPDFNLTQYIENSSIKCKEMFVHCIVYIFDVPCCMMFEPILTPHGICYTWLPDQGVNELERLSRDSDFTIVIDMQNVPDTEKPVDVGYVAYVTSPRIKEVSFRLSAGHSMMNGFATMVKTRLIKTSRLALFTPWHGLWTACPTLPTDLDIWDDGERFFKRACDKLYTDQKIRNACGCRVVLDRHSNTSLRLCDPEDIYDCFLNQAFKDNLTGMAIVCPYPCIEYHYESEVNFFKIGGQNISRLLYMYDGSQYVFNEYRKTTFSSFLSQIGGVMGLYVGASIITVVELVSFFAGWLWYSFLPSKRASTSVTSLDLHRKTPRHNNLYFY